MGITSRYRKREQRFYSLPRTFPASELCVRRIGSVNLRALASHRADGWPGSSDIGCVAHGTCGYQTRKPRLCLVRLNYDVFRRGSFDRIQPVAGECFSEPPNKPVGVFARASEALR
jgi:hypothetical protein